MMGGWREAKRLDAGSGGAKESVLQDIFNEWAERRTPVAGTPDWLWALPTPERPTHHSFGYKLIPDAYWGMSRPRIVGELKYGLKFEMIAVAEALHYAHILRRIEGGEPIHSVVITQMNYGVRAAIVELASPILRHIEADLLTLDKQTLLWLSCPHAPLGELPSMPREFPLEQNWTSLRWFAVEGELTWIAHDGKHKPPFLQGPAAMISRFRNGGRYEWMLWTGRLPELGEQWSDKKWADSGSYWVWDAEARTKNQEPPAPR